MLRIMAAQLLLAAAAAAAAPGVLSPLPPMGFNSWARYMGALNESLFLQTAAALAATGLQAAGYTRLNLDDAWSLPARAANGSMQWDPAKFPRGLPWLAAALKAQGFAPGIYTDAGNLSCGGYPGASGHEELDARTFSEWGFSYLKLDGCHMVPDASEATYRAVYGRWAEVLAALPQPMVFSESAPAYFAEAGNLTSWYEVMGWVPQLGQLARHSRDSLVWNSTSYWPDITGWDSVLFNYGQEVRLARFQRAGFVNDPDFLNVDHFDYTEDERRSHFALWASLGAPLILSTDVMKLTAPQIEYLTNRELIAVNQDPLVQQATLVSQDGTWDVLTKSLSNGDRLVTVLNRGSVSADLGVSWARIGILPDALATPSSGGGGGGVVVKDLWTGASTAVPLRGAGIAATGVPAHGTAIFRLANVTRGAALRTVPTGMIFNTFSLNCLTAPAAAASGGGGGGGGVRWARCTAADAQVWRVAPDGRVGSLRDTGACVAVEGAAVVARAGACGAEAAARWEYSVAGNLVHAATGRCLTEEQGEGRTTGAFVADCGYLTNEQVIALPVGVAL